MPYKITAILILITLAMSAMEAHAMQSPNTVFYVAANGNDAWSGTIPVPNEMHTDGPFSGIYQAQIAARKARTSHAEGAVTVLLREGTYTLRKPLIFTPDDSHTTYAAYPGENPVISGGKRITGWKKMADGRWTTNLPADWYFHDLYVNGERRMRPRLPKDGFFNIAGPVSAEVKNAFVFKEGDVKPWKNINDVEVVYFNAWDELRFRIAGVDEKNHVITFTGANNWPMGNWGGGNRYYAENVLEAFDQPGQWYLDRKSGVLAYRPLPGEDMKKAEVIAPVINELVRIDGDVWKQKFVERLALKGLSFRYAGWDLPKESYISLQSDWRIGGVILANGAHNCRIEDCEISHVGGYGIEFADGCKNNVITRNSIHNMGAGGVKIGTGAKDQRDFEQTAGNEVSHNHIYDLGHNYLSAVGIWVGNSGHNLISRNHIHDLNYTGISVGWTWGYAPTLTQENIIEHNHIHDVGRGLLSDMGGIYTLGNATGSVIRYNLIHDVKSFSYGGWGIYLDEGTSDMLVENNIVYRTKTGGFHQHYGKENIIRNNIFAYAKEGQIQRSRDEEHLSFTFEHNIVYWNEGPLFVSNWNNPTHYKLDHNIYWNTSDGPAFAALGTDEFDKWQSPARDEHSVIADPLFVDPEHGNFTLAPDSPVEKLGFKPIVGAGD